MKRLKPWLIATIAAALTLSIVASVSAQGPLGPSSFPVILMGTVTDDAGEVPADLAVEAYIGDGTKVCNDGSAETYRAEENGQQVTKYWLRVLSAEIEPGCGTDGDTVRIKIGDRWAAETGTWTNPGVPRTLNLTLAPEVTSVTVDVTVWQSVRTSNIFVSTRPQGAGWTTHNTPIDLSTLSASGNFYQGSPVTVTVDLGGGTSVNIDVTVWRSVRTGNHFVSTRPEGAGWTTHNTPIDLSNLSASGNFYQGTAVTAEVDLQ